MRHAARLLTLALVVAAPALAEGERPPLVGDPVNGEKLYKAASKKAVKVDGNWLNAVSEARALRALQKGADGFPRLRSDNELDLYDVLAYLRSRNTDIADLQPEADHVLISDPELDKHAAARLKDRAKLEATEGDDHRVFAFYKLGKGGDEGLRRVFMDDHKKRDALKPKKKVGYVVFVPLKGLRGGKLEAAIAVSPDINITSVVIRGPDGEMPADLNQAARRFVGQGGRGKYDALRAVGAGKAIRELAKPLSEAFLRGMEHVYMFEVEEREYFAFDE